MKTILVVDDDTDVLTSIKEGLNILSNEYEIVGAEDGEQCLDLLNDGLNPDLIILDIMLPEMDGFQIHDLIKSSKDWFDIPIVFLTALEDDSVMQKGIKTGSYCIKKPFNIKQLKETIERVLSGDNLF